MAGRTPLSLGARLLLGIAIVFSLLWWPFEIALRSVGRLLSGGRKPADAGDDAVADADNVKLLIAALAPDRPDIAAKALENDPADRWNVAVELLQDAALIGAIDWRSEPSELQAALDPMLARHGARVDWSFVDDLEAREDWNAIKNENLVPRVAREIEKLGLVLAHIDEGSDAYVMAVRTPEEFARIDGVGGGGVRIGRFT